MECLAVIINSLLRNYITFSHYEQAEKIVSKSSFPENASSNQVARYFYYLGRIKAIQLEYSKSHDCLIHAIRKAPQTEASAGFQQAVHKLSIIIQLLMGEIPERSVFRQKMLKNVLTPYFYLTQAVRAGDLVKFQDILVRFKGAFETDKTYTLIMRLRHSVIKAGIKRICLSYSRISLEDVKTKLCLESKEDAEYIIAKAVKDGVIDAVIDHEEGYVRSRETMDVYSTNEPQETFDQRIAFCNQVYNDSVKAMRYPKKQGITEKVLEELKQNREQLEKEIENELNDEDGMDF